MSENNSELVLNCSSHILCGISAFDKATFSGQNTVRTPTQLHPRSSSMPFVNSAISPTERLLTSYYTASKIDHNYHFFDHRFITRGA